MLKPVPFFNHPRVHQTPRESPSVAVAFVAVELLEDRGRGKGLSVLLRDLSETPVRRQTKRGWCRRGYAFRPRGMYVMRLCRP
ncbi:unnamed protein product [Lota lota]